MDVGNDWRALNSLADGTLQPMLLIHLSATMGHGGLQNEVRYFKAIGLSCYRASYAGHAHDAPGDSSADAKEAEAQTQCRAQNDASWTNDDGGRAISTRRHKPQDSY